MDTGYQKSSPGLQAFVPERARGRRDRETEAANLQKQEDSLKVTISTCEFFLCFTFHFDVLGKHCSFIEHLSDGEIQLRFDLSLLVLQTFAHRQT